MENKWQCRIAPSLGGGFAGTPASCWGTKDYENDTDPAVFFGLYGLPDFYALWRHKGRRAILWAGTDIQHFIHGYWLEPDGSIRMGIRSLARWINKNCENYCENEREQQVLKQYGINSIVAPSFLGDIDDYEVSFKPSKKVYTSVSGDNFQQYGWDKIPELALNNPDIEFYLYGNRLEWKCDESNVIVRGRVPKEQMFTETKEMAGALRLTRFDGFSELLAESSLWGQWPVSPFIKYPHILSSLSELKDKIEPNLEGREYYRKNLNLYPWVSVTKS